MIVGLLLAILIDQRVRGEVGLADDLSLSAGGLLRRHRHGLELALQPDVRHRDFVRGLGWTSFKFAWITDRDMAIYAVVITGIWHASGFAMALFLAGLRSVDQDLIKAAQIDGAGMGRIYRRIVLPSIRPIFVAVVSCCCNSPSRPSTSCSR